MDTFVRIISWCPSEVCPSLDEEDVADFSARHFAGLQSDIDRFVVLVPVAETAGFDRFLAPPQCQDEQFCYWHFPAQQEAHLMFEHVALMRCGAGCWVVECIAPQALRVAAQ